MGWAQSISDTGAKVIWTMLSCTPMGLWRAFLFCYSLRRTLRVFLFLSIKMEKRSCTMNWIVFSVYWSPGSIGFTLCAVSANIEKGFHVWTNNIFSQQTTVHKFPPSAPCTVWDHLPFLTSMASHFRPDLWPLTFPGITGLMVRCCCGPVWKISNIRPPTVD